MQLQQAGVVLKAVQTDLANDKSAAATTAVAALQKALEELDTALKIK